MFPAKPPTAKTSFELWLFIARIVSFEAIIVKQPDSRPCGSLSKVILRQRFTHWKKLFVNLKICLQNRMSLKKKSVLISYFFLCGVYTSLRIINSNNLIIECMFLSWTEEMCRSTCHPRLASHWLLVWALFIVKMCLFTVKLRGACPDKIVCIQRLNGAVFAISLQRWPIFIFIYSRRVFSGIIRGDQHIINAVKHV